MGESSEGMGGLALWASEAWQAEALRWVDDRLAESGLTRTGDPTQPHARAWATVLRVPTSGGLVWLKAAAAGAAFEMNLYELLRAVTPAQVLTPLAVDVDLGWILLPDGGPQVSARSARDGALTEALTMVLPQYAELQRSLIPYADAMVSLGVSDMGAAVMSARFDEAVAAVRAYVDRQGTEQERAKFERAAAMRTTFAGWCEQLSQSVVGPSIDHNDLHLGNVFHSSPGRFCFYDWGDSVVAHPFASMLVGLGSVRRQLGVSVDDPVVTRPRDAYLEVFTDLAPRRELLAEMRLACTVGKVARALVWQRTVGMEGAPADEASTPLDAFAALLSESWLDAWG